MTDKNVFEIKQKLFLDTIGQLLQKNNIYAIVKSEIKIKNKIEIRFIRNYFLNSKML